MTSSSVGHSLQVPWHSTSLPWLLSLSTLSDSSAGTSPSYQPLNISFVEILTSAYTSYPAAPKDPSKWTQYPGQASLLLLFCISTLLNKAKLKLLSSKWQRFWTFSFCRQYCHSLLLQAQNPQPSLAPSSGHIHSASRSVTYALPKVLTSISFEFFLPHP